MAEEDGPVDGPADLLEEALPVAVVVAVVSQGEVDLLAAEALREAGETETAIRARGAQSHRCRDCRDRAEHCGGSASRRGSRQRSLFALSSCMGCDRRDSARRASQFDSARYRKPHRDHDPTVVPGCYDAATRMASDPALDCTETRQARSRLATRASRIQRACAGSSDATAPNPAVRIARRTLRGDRRRS